MNSLLKLFPLSSRAKNSGKDLAISIIIYVILAVIGSVLLGIAGLFTGIPVLGAILGIVLRIIGILMDVYVLGGVIIAILAYLGMF